MPSHVWGDDWFNKHGSDLDDAIWYCITTWKRYGRIGSHGKEKWGSFRDHPYFFDGTLHSLVYPGYVYIQFPNWFYWNIDYSVIKKITYYTGIWWLIFQWQKVVYNYAIQTVCKRYPEIIDELVYSLDGYEFVKPGIFGKVDGTAIHNKYWITVE